MEEGIEGFCEKQTVHLTQVAIFIRGKASTSVKVEIGGVSYPWDDSGIEWNLGSRLQTRLCCCNGREEKR
jgi:hypothetical protein